MMELKSWITLFGFSLFVFGFLAGYGYGRLVAYKKMRTESKALLLRLKTLEKMLPK